MARARLSMAFQDVRGRMNDQVVTRTRYGLATKHRPTYKYPKNADVEAGSSRLREANALWNDLNHVEAEAWRTYALTLSRRDPVTLEWYSPTAKNAFVGLAVKVMQILEALPLTPQPPLPTWGEGEHGLPLTPDPLSPKGRGGVIPRLPPTSDFLGDNLTVPAEAIEGGVRFTPSSPNSEGVVTELMFQRLPNPRRAPVKFYKSLAFVAFEGPTDIDLEPGIYYFGYRFVNATTGQMTEMLGLGAVAVE